MEEKRVCFGHNKGYMNLETTLDLAQKVFSEKKPYEVAHRLGIEYDGSKSEFILPFLNEEHRIKYPCGDVYRPDGRDVPLVNKILILHYLNSSKGVPLRNRWISFKELPFGQIYIDPFYNRAVRPLIGYFGEKPELMLEAGMALGGRKGEMGDVSVVVTAFPLVPVAYVIWKGDEEFPPSGNILFDESAPDHLPTEDYAVLASTIVFEMRRLAETKR